MKRIIILFVILFCFFSCGQSQKKTVYRSCQELEEAFDSLAMDPNATWDEIVSFANLFADTLAIRANDSENLRNRIMAQDNGYMLIAFVTDKYDELKSAGKDVNYDDVPKLLDKLIGIESIWFYEEDEKVPHVWRDHYYVSHQDSEQEVFGYFHIMVTLPCEVLPEPTVQIFYPESAEEDPILVFSKYLSGDTIEEDPDQRVVIHPDSWAKKDELEEGYPMYAKLGAETVEKMLNYDVLYLMFQSGVSPIGDPGRTEIARLSLNSFQAIWKDVSQSNVSE